jgi:hypothetical protein
MRRNFQPLSVSASSVVLEHALGELGLGRALHFRVNQHPEVVTFSGAHIDEFVGVAPAAVGITGDLLQFAVERAVGGVPASLSSARLTKPLHNLAGSYARD